MVKLARNEQCIILYPLMARYSVGPFPANVIFRPSESPFILWLIPIFVYLRPVTVIFCLWGKFSLSLQSARSRNVNTLGRFHGKKNPLGCFRRVIKYGLLTTRYGPRIVWPMIGEMIIHPIEGPWILRPVEGPLLLRPVGGPVSLQ